jgi:hypothetical protein
LCSGHWCFWAMQSLQTQKCENYFLWVGHVWVETLLSNTEKFHCNINNINLTGLYSVDCPWWQQPSILTWCTIYKMNFCYIWWLKN